MSDNNVISLVQSSKVSEEKGYVRITFNNILYEFTDEGTNYEEEILQADTFGHTQDMPGFIVFWREEPDELIGFYNSRFIRKIEVLNDYKVGE